jgi:hypothetical protein
MKRKDHEDVEKHTFGDRGVDGPFTSFGMAAALVSANKLDLEPWGN